jgi:signal peptidase
VGQVISYQIPIGDHHVESHRVIRLEHDRGSLVVQTKGDANPTADPWRAKLTSPTAWRVRLVFPNAGWVIIWFRNPLVQRLSVLVAPLTLAIWWLIGIWRPPPASELENRAT